MLLSNNDNTLKMKENAAFSFIHEEMKEVQKQKDFYSKERKKQTIAVVTHWRGNQQGFTQ